MFTFGCAESTSVNYVFLCHDSAIRASTIALAAPSVRKHKQIQVFVWYFTHLIVPLASPKILSLNNKKKKRFSFVLYSFIRIFGFAEDTFTRKYKQKQAFVWYFAHLIVSLTSSKILPLNNKKKNTFFFCIVFVYSYLCTRIVRKVP